MRLLDLVNIRIKVFAMAHIRIRNVFGVTGGAWGVECRLKVGIIKIQEITRLKLKNNSNNLHKCTKLYSRLSLDAYLTSQIII